MPLSFIDRLWTRLRRRDGVGQSVPTEAPCWELADDLCVVRMRDGSLVFLDPRDESVGAPVRTHGAWEPGVTLVLKRLLRPGGCAIDVGSNIGCHVITMAHAIGSTGSLLAIEANPEVAELLRCTVTANRLRNVRIVQAAVLDRAGEVELFAHYRNLGAGAVGLPGWEADPALQRHSRYRVASTTLDQLTADLDRADLIRMDVEGCELAVLAGAERLLSRSPDVKIVCEWGAHHAPSYFGIEDGLDLLIAQGFRFWRILPEGALLPQSKRDMLGCEFGDVIMARQPTWE